MIGFDQMTALDLTGPVEVFATAGKLAGKEPAYALTVLGSGGRPFTSESGLSFRPHGALEDALHADTIIVPGGAGLRAPEIAAPVIRFLKSRFGCTRRMVSICTGIYAFGEAGLLDGRRATTHWQFVADVQKRYPKATLVPDAIYLRDGSFYSSAGVTAGIDLALHLVEEDLGERIALAVARELVVYVKRPGGQLQFSEPLQFQVRAVDRFADLARWMIGNLQEDLSVNALADRAGMSARHFSRVFTATFGLPPAEYVERLRLDEARRRLPSPHQTVDSVAASVGYASADTFRRAFERRFGIAPSLYRERFPV